MTKYFFQLFFLTLSIVFFNHFSASAQYYYKDILSTQKLNNEFLILKNENIKVIKISSFDENNQPSEGFFCEKKNK